MSFLQNKGKRISRLIDFSEIQFNDSSIGQGGFGKVYSGFLNNRKVGIKKITSYDNDPNREKIEKFIEREIDILKFLSTDQFKHPNVIQYYGLALKENSLYLLTELVQGGDLHWYIKNKDMVNIGWKLKFQIARDIASAMSFIHSNGIIHRDLKSTNLLVDENWVIKICDMGLARQVDNINEKKLMTICGSDAWMAPELLLGEKYDNSCDVFSFGMVLIELIIRENLTPRLRNEDLGIEKTFLHSKTPEDCPKDLIKLVYECCHVKPALRPSFAAIYNVLDYLLGYLQFEDVQLPKLRNLDSSTPYLTTTPTKNTFPRPFGSNNNNATINGSQESMAFPVPYVSNVNNNHNHNNNASQESMAFPRPYVPSTFAQNPYNNNVNNNRDIDPSGFSFPRPYVPSTIQNTNNNRNEDISDPSGFSFPRPYIPSTIQHTNNNNNNTSNHDISDPSGFSFPRPYMPSKIVSQNQDNNNNNNDNHQHQYTYEYDEEEEEEEEYDNDEEEEEEYRKPPATVITFNTSELLSFPKSTFIPPSTNKNNTNDDENNKAIQQLIKPDTTEPKPGTPPNQRKIILNASLTFNNQFFEKEKPVETKDDSSISVSIHKNNVSIQQQQQQKSKSPEMLVQNGNGEVGNKVDHRRSRSLDLKTKGIIKKFEEFTRFNSVHSWISKDKDHKEHKEKEHKEKDHKEHKDKEHKDHKDKDHKEKDHKEKDHKEHKEKEHKDKEHKEKEHKDHKDKDHKEKDHKEKDKEHKEKEHKDKEHKDKSSPVSPNGSNSSSIPPSSPTKKQHLWGLSPILTKKNK